MNKPSFTRLFLLIAAATGLCLVTAAQAQQAPAPGPQPPMSPGARPPGAPGAPNPLAITPQEWQELRAARTAALQANPDLTAEHTKLLQRMQDFEKKVDAAMVKADPNMAPILAKLEAARPHVGAGPMGAPGAPPVPSTAIITASNTATPAAK